MLLSLKAPTPTTKVGLQLLMRCSALRLDQLLVLRIQLAHFLVYNLQLIERSNKLADVSMYVCYVVLCCVMLRYVVLGLVRFGSVRLCAVMLCYAVPYHAVLCDAMPCYVLYEILFQITQSVPNHYYLTHPHHFENVGPFTVSLNNTDLRMANGLWVAAESA